MTTAVICIIGLVGSWGHADAEFLVEGRVQLDSGAPVPGAQVQLFDLADLRAAPLAATTDRSGRFTLPLATLAGTLPERFRLGANYPNPFNPSTMIPYQLPAAMRVRLEVFNILGQQVATLVDGDHPAGFHKVSWDATDAAGEAVGAGVYLYRLSGDGVQATRSMLLIDGQAGIPWGRGGSTRSGGGLAKEAGGQTPVYGLTVSGLGLAPYVDPSFRVEAGMAPVDVVVTAPASVPASAKAASSGGILGDVDNTGGVDFFDALLVALYSLNPSVVMPNHGDISLGDVNADGQVDLSDAWAIAAWLNDPSDPVLPAGIGEPVGAALASLSPDPSTVTFADDGGWHRFTVEAGEPVSVVANPEDTGRRLEITTRSGRGNFCPAEAEDDVSRQDGQTLYLSGCTEGSATVELRRESDGTVLRTYTFEVTASPADLVVESISVSDSTLTPGQSFNLNATVRNQGTGPSAATALRYYRSSNRTISTQDTQVGTDQMSALAASGTSAESIRLTAPSSEGTYYYGACVVSVRGESAGNNCSAGARVIISVDEIAAVTPARSGLGPTEAGKRAEERVVVTVRGTSGAPVAGASWRWSTDERSGWVFPAQGVTAADGRIVATWVAGSPGAGVLTLMVENRVSSISTDFTTESVVSRNPPSGAFYVNPTNRRRAAGYSVDLTPLTEPHGTFYAAIQWDGGYTGLQRGGSLYDRQLQFSVWDAPGGGAAQVIESGEDVVCESFGGEGTGRKCQLNYPWRVGDTYRFEVTEAELDGGSAMTLHVTELATGDRRFVGTIRYALRARLYSFGVFVEDFIGEAPTCLAQAVRSVAIRRSRAYINGEWHPITSGEVSRHVQDAKNPGTPPCANLATRDHPAGLEMVMGGRTMSDPDTPRHVIIP